MKYLVVGVALLLSCGEPGLPGGKDSVDEVTPTEDTGTEGRFERVDIPVELEPLTNDSTGTPETPEDTNDDGDLDNDDVDNDCSDDDSEVDNSEDTDDEGGIETYTPRDCGEKTLLCHLPPGNPENRHELCLDEKAVEAHLDKHMDFLGGCQD